MSPKPATAKSSKSPSASSKKSSRFTVEEKSAMRQRAKELKAGEADGESAIQEKIAEMAEPDRALAKRLHALIKASAPTLASSTWYGMPAYTLDGKVVCFFQPAAKFKARYAELGFNDKANLDEGGLWPVAYAVKDLTPSEEARISALVKKAVS